jgi:hypothetical protein
VRFGLSVATNAVRFNLSEAINVGRVSLSVVTNAVRFNLSVATNAVRFSLEAATNSVKFQLMSVTVKLGNLSVATNALIFFKSANIFSFSSNPREVVCFFIKTKSNLPARVVLSSSHNLFKPEICRKLNNNKKRR